MPYDHDGDPVDPHDVLDREELADYERSQRTKGTRRYGRETRHTGDAEGAISRDEDAYEAWLDRIGGSA